MDSTVAAHTKLVTVTLTVTDDDGHTQTDNKEIPGGPTPVVDLKVELGVPAETSLWVINAAGKKHQLADHQNHNVKEGDRFEALVPGGVS